MIRAGRDMYAAEEFGSIVTVKKKSKKEEMIDKKIEYLLETYKKHDEALMKKAIDKSSKKRGIARTCETSLGFQMMKMMMKMATAKLQAANFKTHARVIKSNLKITMQANSTSLPTEVVYHRWVLRKRAYFDKLI